MHYKLVDEKPKAFILVFETNDEFGWRDVAQTALAFARPFVPVAAA